VSGGPCGSRGTESNEKVGSPLFAAIAEVIRGVEKSRSEGVLAQGQPSIQMEAYTLGCSKGSGGRNGRDFEYEA